MQEQIRPQEDVCEVKQETFGGHMGHADPCCSEVRKGGSAYNGVDSVLESPDRSQLRSHKLKSGKTAKPDEAGIICVVQYTHEKLDSIHIKNRLFNELSFHFLVVGEIELILQEKMKPVEKQARLHFLKTLCYHKEYLEVGDIRDQYNATLKLIECGENTWSDYKDLASQLHNSLTFHATVNARKKEPVVPTAKKEAKDPVKDIPAGKVVYCMDFNRGNCPFENHHQGMFNRKEVTKWHITE